LTKERKNNMNVEHLIMWVDANVEYKVYSHSTFEDLQCSKSTINKIEKDLLNYEDIIIDLSKYNKDITLLQITVAHNQEKISI